MAYYCCRTQSPLRETLTRAMTFSFKEQLALGEQGEREVVEYLSKFYNLSASPMELQRLGIDYIAVEHKTGARFTIEIKTDFVAQTTGNIFLEFEVNKKPGWVLSSVAQVLIYYVPPKLYFLNMYALRQDYQKKLIEGPPSSQVKNENYYALGTLYPLDKLQWPVLLNIVRIK